MNESVDRRLSNLESALKGLRYAAKTKGWERAMGRAQAWAALSAGVCVGWLLGKWTPDPWSRAAALVAMIGPMLVAHFVFRYAKRLYVAEAKAALDAEKRESP